jgi:hypothetical protein
MKSAARFSSQLIMDPAGAIESENNVNNRKGVRKGRRVILRLGWEGPCSPKTFADPFNLSISWPLMEEVYDSRSRW